MSFVICLAGNWAYVSSASTWSRIRPDGLGYLLIGNGHLAGYGHMVGKGFEKLRVYELAEKLADEVWKIVLRMDLFAKDTIGKQLVRAADSIGANIAEGVGRGTFQDKKRFVRIARGSLYETRHWLRRLFTRQLLNPEQIETLQPIIRELSPKLNSYLKSIGTKKDPNPKNDQ